MQEYTVFLGLLRTWKSARVDQIKIFIFAPLSTSDFKSSGNQNTDTVKKLLHSGGCQFAGKHGVE
jgi:replication initiation and membrane attachment protein DnaB